ncbi:conserved protein [Tepidicaulis marinus]|uniref:Conserved protein n=1 Tax=Tepidicaulis marinus TaxID=1333998 RepID=A0A081BAQ6_9HYPH|nr:DUF1491 family protein [Tepidicaulis marinus]GAK45124.1 conserved protein [Tepidicaulis marinus]
MPHSDEPRLKAEIWVKALIRRAGAENVPAMVVRRGDDTSGTVLVKVNGLDGTAMVYARARAGDGSPVWIPGNGPEPVSEADADAYIERQRKFDPDIWVVEIEDPARRHFLQEKVEGEETRPPDLSASSLFKI